jgi:clan AA aspartic protease (TIGR02281 family)
MRFRFEDADREAVTCIEVASTTRNDTAKALCGWLRLNLARIRNDYSALVAISNDMGSANRLLLDRAGVTDEAAAQSSTLFFLTQAGGYQDVESWPRPTVQWSTDKPETLRVDMSQYGHAFVNALVDKRSAQFDLDTGSAYTLISPELAKEWGLSISKHQEYQVDVRGNATVYSMALVPSIKIGSVVVHDFPVLVGRYGFDRPILGMDFLFKVGTFGLSSEGLIFNGPSINACRSPAMLRASIAPDLPTVGFATHTDHGNLYASLDTGAQGVGYAMGSWKIKEKLGVKDAYTLQGQSVITLSAKNDLGFVSARIKFLSGDFALDRELRIYPDMSLNTDIVMTRQSIEDFSFYYDLPRGMACMHANNHSSAKKSP